MTPATLHRQRCWNHASREAVCRCPSCSRFFCRECVTEHDERLLCAACVLKAVTAQKPTHSWRRRWLLRAAAAAGLALAWTAFYGAGRALSEISARIREQQWPTR
jgi:hypothetical protein